MFNSPLIPQSTLVLYSDTTMASALHILELEIEISLRCQRVFRDRLNPLEQYSDREVITRYRITRYMFIQILDQISSKVHRSTTRSYSIPATTQLAVALQFLATGTFQTVVASAHGVSQTSVSRCVTAVCDALASIAHIYIQFPNETRQKIIQESFFQQGGFPLVFGCIDGSHIPIIAPSCNEDIYVNRKLYHSINIQAICDDEFRFIDAVVKWPCCTHDAFIWRQSGLNRKIASGEISTVNGWFLGDSAYGLRTNLMTPIPSPITPGQRRFNRAFVKVPKTIECTFGIWKSRWRSMDKTGGTLCYTPERVCKIILATMLLHNMCINHGLSTVIDIIKEHSLDIDPLEPSANGVIMRQEIVSNFFD